jgi:deoxyribodipyrimidine photo-lyase
MSELSSKIRQLNSVKNTPGTADRVLYWMSREQRVDSNFALIEAYKKALENSIPLDVVFVLREDLPHANLRQYDFMLRGLIEVKEKLENFNINFYLIKSAPNEFFNNLMNSDCEYSAIYLDFTPLRGGRKMRKETAAIAEERSIPVHEVDSNNIVPVWEASDKEEFAARTLRPKIHEKLDRYLNKPDNIDTPLRISTVNDFLREKSLDFNEVADIEKILGKLNIDKSVKPVEWIKPGASEAEKVLVDFIENKLPKYSELSNDPNQDVLSNLSPYLHFGQISSLRVALKVKARAPGDQNRQDFLEQLIVRRELAENYCYYNQDYDNFEGFREWAKETLNEHRDDAREYQYSLKQFENTETHDPLWNRAQQNMVEYGKMHGYMRMYWGKKILEWTESPEQAMEFAIYLNDKYELDGRDPNGFTGIAWCIGGVHDHGWKERPVYGKIRYMNYNGAKRKFDVKKYTQD